MQKPLGALSVTLPRASVVLLVLGTTGSLFAAFATGASPFCANENPAPPVLLHALNDALHNKAKPNTRALLVLRSQIPILMLFCLTARMRDSTFVNLTHLLRVFPKRTRGINRLAWASPCFAALGHVLV